MHERGLPIDKLASVFDVHRTTVMTHLDRAGVERREPVVDLKIDLRGCGS